jgi:DNA invertase Pin-like site-specific DNA recombinase
VKAVVYMRVSTASQDTENQRASCLELCRRHGFDDPIVIEETASGARLGRAGWDQVMALALGGEIGAVVVWALDRIGRSLQEVFKMVEALDKARVRLLSVREPWLDLGDAAAGAARDPMRTLLVMVFAWAAEFERERILQRSREGREVARREGRVGGRPRTAMVGEPLALAVKMHAAGLSAVKIQRALFERGVYRSTPAGFRGKPKPVPLSTIHSAVTRVTTFEGVTPERPKKAS